MKKLSVILLSATLLASMVPVQSYAAVTSDSSMIATNTAVITKGEPVGSNITPSDQKLQSAIVAVKNVITIPKEYTEFNYYFFNTSAYSDSYWSLSWTDPKNYSVIQVNCDINNNITYYYKYEYNSKDSGIAKFLKSELKATAEEFIKKIAPEVSKYMVYTDCNYEGVYSGNYTYNFERKNNGVDFSDNKVSVSVNSVTGEVTAATINWLYDITVPSSTTKITKEEAVALIKKNMKMKLVYRSDSYGIYSDVRSTAQKAYLVYEPTQSYISVDAKTGEVYLTRSEWVETANTKGGGRDTATATAEDSAASAVTLTDEEITKIEELKNLITKSDAIKKVTSNKYLYLDKNLKSYSATLQKQNDGNDTYTYVWHISLNDPREVSETDKDTYRAYAYATVDAKSGKILSFNSSLKSNYDEANQKWNTVKITYNKKQGKTTLEKFLQSQIKNYFNNSVLVDQSDDYVAYYKEKDPVYGGYNYQYNRVNEGVEYPYNSIYGSVDGVTGKIYSFGYNWDNDITFESTKGAISADKAMDYYLSKDGFGLKYEINTINKVNSTVKAKNEIYDDSNDNYSVDYEIRLVYRPDIEPSYISPFTGEQLNYNGEVYTQTKPFTYKDVDNSQKYRNILLLADMNIGFEGENFLPDKNISIGEIDKILSDVGYESSTITSDNKEALITKEELAQMFIAKLGLEKMSNISGIYKTGYSDENAIDSKYLGAVALAKGLGIMGGDSNNYFNPKNKVTRLDAVGFIMAFINAQQSGLY